MSKKAACVQSGRVHVLDRDGVFEVKESGIPGAGSGVFCAEDVGAGTIIPYHGVAVKESKAPRDLDRTFCIGADFNNSRGYPQTSKIYAMNGNPLVEPIRSLDEHKKLGCRINEASRPLEPNCLLAVNPFLTKSSFKSSFEGQEPIVAALVVIPEDLAAGTELLTSYGPDFGERDYKPCKMRGSRYEAMVDRVYDLVDLLAQEQRRPPTVRFEEP